MPKRSKRFIHADAPLIETPERFGRFDRKTGAWVGRPQEVGDALIAADSDRPRERATVRRIATAVDKLREAGAVNDDHVHAADRFARDWSFGTGQPMRASEARFLGVDLGSAAHADGISVRTIDAASAHRKACAAVGRAGSARLIGFACLDLSLSALSDDADAPIKRQDVRGALISDLERLREHYAEEARARGRASNTGGR